MAAVTASLVRASVEANKARPRCIGSTPVAMEANLCHYDEPTIGTHGSALAEFDSLCSPRIERHKGKVGQCSVECAVIQDGGVQVLQRKLAPVTC